MNVIAALEKEHDEVLAYEYFDNRVEKVEHCRICGEELTSKDDDLREICCNCARRIHKGFDNFVESIMEGDLNDFKDCKDFLIDYIVDKCS